MARKTIEPPPLDDPSTLRANTLLMTPADAARQLAISEKQLRELTTLGKIRYVNIGNGDKRETRRYALQDLESFVEARSKQECRSTGAPARRSTRTTSGVVVHDFQALRAKRNAEKRKNSKKASETEPKRR